MKREAYVGKHGQNLAAAALSRIGVELVEQIGTPVKLIPASQSRKDVFRVVWGEKVSGDHRGILPGGRSVLAETKTILDRNLQYSDLRPHQPAALTAHAKMGGASLLVWVHSSGIFILQWPIEGFESGTSISPAMAEYLTIVDVVP